MVKIIKLTIHRKFIVALIRATPPDLMKSEYILVTKLALHTQCAALIHKARI